MWCMNYTSNKAVAKKLVQRNFKNKKVKLPDTLVHIALVGEMAQ